jgi:KipI family sensor histidine kinase inhibitor
VSVGFQPAGDLAVLVELDGDIGAALSTRLRALDMLIVDHLPAVRETVPAFRSLLVYYDPLETGYAALCESIADLESRAGTAELPQARIVELPCCYADRELGFDLERAAGCLGISTSDLIALHSGAEYLVYFIGFAPGQPYLTGTPDRLVIPRLDTPRTTTPPGSVAIGGTQSCIYSVESPGGFWVLGRTPVPIYDRSSVEPILLRPGDRLRFRAIERDQFDEIAAAVERRAYTPAIS